MRQNPEPYCDLSYPRLSGTRVQVRREHHSALKTYLPTGGNLEPLDRGFVGLGLAVTRLGLGLAHRHRHRFGLNRRRLRGDTHGVDGLAETETGHLRGRGEKRGGHRERRHCLFEP